MKRNDTCSCGSGKKFKHCCESKESKASSKNLVKYLIIGILLAVASVATWNVASKYSQRVDIPEGHVWCSNCARYHAPDQE